MLSRPMARGTSTSKSSIRRLGSLARCHEILRYGGRGDAPRPSPRLPLPARVASRSDRNPVMPCRRTSEQANRAKSADVAAQSPVHRAPAMVRHCCGQICPLSAFRTEAGGLKANGRQENQCDPRPTTARVTRSCVVCTIGEFSHAYTSLVRLPLYLPAARLARGASAR